MIYWLLHKLQFGRQGGMSSRFGRGEQANHAVAGERVHLTVQGALWHAGFTDTGGSRMAEEDDRTDDLVLALFGGLYEQRELLLVVGGRHTGARKGRHGDYYREIMQTYMGADDTCLAMPSASVC